MPGSTPSTLETSQPQTSSSGTNGSVMKAVRLHAPGDVRCEEVPVPQIKPDEVLIKVQAVGICGSDPARVMKKGTYSYPMTLGHEFSGEVVEVGRDVSGVTAGTRVTVAPLIPCHRCEYCQVGSYQLCEDYSYYGSRTDGALAEYVAVKAFNLIPLPDQVDYETGACTDPAAIALHAVRRSGLRVGDDFVVVGAGLIGLFALQWARLMGARRTVAIDVFPEKLDVASQLGATHVINAAGSDPVAAVMDITENKGADVVIELAGLPKTQEQSVRMARKQGSIVLCGISTEDLILPARTVEQILRKELSVKGAWNSYFAPVPLNEWKTTLRYMASGQLISKPAVSHRLSLEETPAIFPKIWERREFIHKVMVFPNGQPGN